MSILHLVLYFMVTSVAAYTNPRFCTPHIIGDSGLSARFYSYQLGDSVGKSPDFFNFGWKTTLLHTVNGITDPNFSNSAPDNKVTAGTIYGYDTTISNYTIELSGFYRPSKQDHYTFTLSADDGAALKLGAASLCCIDPAGCVSADTYINTLGTTSGADQSQNTFSLFPNKYYPFTIVIFNANGNSNFALSVTDSSGNPVDFASNSFKIAFSSGGACHRTITTSGWTNAFKSTTTIRGSETDTIVVQVPSTFATTTST